MKKATSEAILAYLETHLSTKRLKHVLGVRDTAMEYAQRRGLSVKQAESAALLHDAAKWMTVPDQVVACTKYGVRLSEDDLRQPSVLHAYVAAEMALREWGADEEVAQAIRAHTTGWKPMSELDMDLYCADFSEPSREYPQAAEIRALAPKDLRSATVLTMTYKLRSLLERGLLIHPRTVEARNNLLPTCPEPSRREGAMNDE